MRLPLQAVSATEEMDTFSQPRIVVNHPFRLQQLKHSSPEGEGLDCEKLYLPLQPLRRGAAIGF